MGVYAVSHTLNRLLPTYPLGTKIIGLLTIMAVARDNTDDGARPPTHVPKMNEVSMVQTAPMSMPNDNTTTEPNRIPTAHARDNTDDGARPPTHVPKMNEVSMVQTAPMSMPNDNTTTEPNRIPTAHPEQRADPARPLRVGLDIGSTTVKAVVLGESDALSEPLFADYRRHHANVRATMEGLLKDIRATLTTLGRADTPMCAPPWRACSKTSAPHSPRSGAPMSRSRSPSPDRAAWRSPTRSMYRSCRR